MSIFASPVLPRAALLVSLLAAACGGGSSEPEQSEQAQTSGAEEEESMSLDAFVAELSRQATPALCGADDAPLRQCFAVDEAQCSEIFGLAMSECANQLRGDLPETIDASNADAAATSISQCAGGAYRMSLEQNGRVRPECQQTQG